MIRIALIASIVISTVSFAWGYWQAGFEGTAWISGFGIFWLLAYWRKWRWFSVPAVFASLFLAALGIWLERHPGWMFNGAVFAIFAYDLVEFQRKLNALPEREDVPGKTRRHILRISLMAAAGLTCVSLFIFLTGQFTNDWGLFLLSAALLGCAQVLAWRKR